MCEGHAARMLTLMKPSRAILRVALLKESSSGDMHCVLCISMPGLYCKARDVLICTGSLVVL